MFPTKTRLISPFLDVVSPQRLSLLSEDLFPPPTDDILSYEEAGFFDTRRKITSRDDWEDDGTDVCCR